MYNSRVWLNPIASDSTGSVVAYDGEVTDLDTGKKYPQTFLEVSDCRMKARLHLTSDDTRESFIQKMKMLKDEIEFFIDHLEKESQMKQILIIGQGGIGKAQLPEHVITEIPADVRDLIGFRSKEALRRLELEKEIPQKILQHSKSYRDEEKINSQQGWKRVSKYMR